MHNLTREQIIGVSAAFIIGVGFFVLTNTFSSPFDIENAERSFSQRVAGSESLKTSSLRVEDVFVGDGIVASAGDTVTVHYAGILTDGTSFDNSLERNQPIRFVLGAGQVIDGWDQGLLGMKEGGRRVLLIPPHLGYGSQGAGIIPPNATLVFEVVLLSVEKAEE